MTPARAMLFDLDGTMLDTAPDMGGALNRLLDEEGRAPLSAAVIRPVVSHGAARLVKLGFPGADGDEFERLRLRFLDLYSRHLAVETLPFPGLLDLLDELERRSVPWGVVTNKPGWLTDPLLDQLRLSARAGCVVSGDTVAERKPHPLPLLHAAGLIRVAPAACVYVGDAERDIQAGRAAGMRTVVAAYGYLGDDDSPASWNATGIVDHPQQLLSWVDRGEIRQ
jgi:N-acetyl-D-muramate 6-phosphate phosphatase